MLPQNSDEYFQTNNTEALSQELFKIYDRSNPKPLEYEPIQIALNVD